MRHNPSHPGRPSGPQRRGAFTLVEILIVVVILGILASIVIPQFSNASQTARENTLKDEIRYLRTQVIVYKAQHIDASPGYAAGASSGAASEQTFSDQMTMFSDEKGNTSATPSTTFKYGPYLSQLPVNSVNGKSTFIMVADGSPMPGPDDTTGWIYKPQTQEVIPNINANDSSGTPYKDY